MRFFDFFKKKNGGVQASADHAAFAEFLRQGGDTASGAVVNMDTVMKTAVAWRCINVISGAIGSTPFDIVKRAGEFERKPAVGHSLRNILTVRPNKWQTPREFRQMLQAHLLLRGNGYARKVYTGREITALIPIHPDRVTPKQRTDLSMEYQVSSSSGQSMTLSQEQIFHLRGLTLDGVTGLSTLSYMREAVGLSLQGERAAARGMKNGTFSLVSLNHPQKLSKEAKESLSQGITDKFSGAENAGKVPVFEEGLELKTVGMSAVDLQFLELRDFQRNDVAMFFGVPPHIAGIPGAASNWGTGIEQQQIGFTTFTLLDWVRIWEETINRDLLDEKEREKLSAKFYLNGLLRGDLKARKEFYVAMLQWGVFSPDIVLALEDMEPRADGKGGVYYDPPNVGTKKEKDKDEPEDASDI